MNSNWLRNSSNTKRLGISDGIPSNLELMIYKAKGPEIRLMCVLSCLVVSDSLWPHGLSVACQAPLSMGFLRQESWSGLPFPTSRESLDPGIKPMSLESLSLPGGFSTTSATWKAQ